MPVYLERFHGTETTDRSNLDRSGEPGPILGPLAWAHTTYADVRCGRLDADGMPNDYASADLRVTGECLLCDDGTYHGDGSMTDGTWALRSRVDPERIRQVDAGRCCDSVASEKSIDRDEGGLLDP
jgi:hypothetical protein